MQSTPRRSRGQGKKLGAFGCDHDYPVLVTNTESGRYYARCLACLAIGPECRSSKAARRALRALGRAEIVGENMRNTSYKGIGV